MNYRIENIPPDILSCVYRLWYGDRYIIAKGKTLAGSVYLIHKGLAYFLAGGGRASQNAAAGVAGEGHKEGQGKNTYYFALYAFVKANPGLKWGVEVILESDNPYQLLKREQEELDRCIRGKRCLNSNVEAYIPQYNPKNKIYGTWISRSHVMCFKKYLKTPVRAYPNRK